MPNCIEAQSEVLLFGRKGRNGAVSPTKVSSALTEVEGPGEVI